MKFSEKLNFLLNLTNTPNNMLAKHLSLDPSYISRLRRGERSVPHADYLRSIASFLPDGVPKNISDQRWQRP